jgi:dolichol kinase
VNASALRRAIHASTASILLLGVVGDGTLLRWVSAGLFGFAMVVELIRLRHEPFRAALARRVPVFRPEESRGASGAFWLLAGYAGAAWFPAPGSAAGILSAALSDPAASAVGTRWGGGAAKSWIGSVAAWGVSAVVLSLLGLSWIAVLTGSTVSAALERWPGRFNDNLLMPIGVAAAVWLVS